MRSAPQFCILARSINIPEQKDDLDIVRLIISMGKSLHNSFIQNEYQRRRYLMKERQKRNRFMGWVLILIMLLFILPTFNLAQSYQQLLQRRQQLADLQTQYQTLSDEKDKETAFATKLKDEDYAAKYTRAKYYYSKSREIVYTIPDLLQR